jgi:hypothetical protein
MIMTPQENPTKAIYREISIQCLFFNHFTALCCIAAFHITF